MVHLESKQFPAAVLATSVGEKYQLLEGRDNFVRFHCTRYFVCITITQRQVLTLEKWASNKRNDENHVFCICRAQKEKETRETNAETESETKKTLRGRLVQRRLRFLGLGLLSQLMNVMSLIETMSRPPSSKPLMAAALPGPNPRILTRTCVAPSSRARLAIVIAVDCAATFVPLRQFLNPSSPHDVLLITY